LLLVIFIFIVISLRNFRVVTDLFKF